MYIRVGTFCTNIIQILNFYLRKYIEFFKVFTFRKYFEEFIWKLLGIHFLKYFEEYIRKLLGTHFLKYFEEFIWKLLSIHFLKYFEEFIRKLLGIHFQKYFEEFIRKLLDIHFRKTFGHTFSEIFWRIYQKTFEQRFALPKTFLKFEFFQKLFYWPFYRIDIDISPRIISWCQFFSHEWKFARIEWRKFKSQNPNLKQSQCQDGLGDGVHPPRIWP